MNETHIVLRNAQGEIVMTLEQEECYRLAKYLAEHGQHYISLEQK